MELPRETEDATNRAASGHGRWYNDACGSAFALEVIGERWALLVVRELMLGARRFSDLRAQLPGLSAKVLTERLVALEAAGVIERRTLPPPGKAQVYALTPWGLAAEPIIHALGRWAALSGAQDSGLPLSAVSLMLSLRANHERESLAAFAGKRIGFVIGEESFLAEPGVNGLSVRRADVAEADAVFSAPSASVIAAGLFRAVPWWTLAAESGLAISGDQALAVRFAKLFALPAPLA